MTDTPNKAAPQPPQASPAPQFAHVHNRVMRGAEWIAVTCSKTMAKRIANALNAYKSNREGA